MRHETGYTVSKCFVKGEAKYTAWTPGAEIIGVFDSAKEAIDQCDGRQK